MVLSRRMDAATYERLAADPQFKLVELHDGIPVEKPGMSFGHGKLIRRLSVAIGGQLDEERFTCRFNHGKLAVLDASYFIPDVMVLPVPEADIDDARGEIYRIPASLVIEIWSPSTGQYDQEEKLPGYMLRGDREIWLVHPHERSVTRWIRRDDAGYERTVLTGGVVTPVDLPDLTVDLDAILRP